MGHCFGSCVGNDRVRNIPSHDDWSRPLPDVVLSNASANIPYNYVIKFESTKHDYFLCGECCLSVASYLPNG